MVIKSTGNSSERNCFKKSRKLLKTQKFFRIFLNTEKVSEANRSVSSKDQHTPETINSVNPLLRKMREINSNNNNTT